RRIWRRQSFSVIQESAFDLCSSRSGEALRLLVVRDGRGDTQHNLQDGPPGVVLPIDNPLGRTPFNRAIGTPSHCGEPQIEKLPSCPVLRKLVGGTLGILGRDL